MAAFYALKEQEPQGKIYAIIQGQSVEGILDMEPLPNRTLIRISIERNHRIETRIVKVEEIESLAYRQLRRPKVKLQLP